MFIAQTSRIALLGILFLGLLGCKATKEQSNLELIQDMMDQTAVKSQEWDDQYGDNTSLRLPPEGTVPIGFKKYAYSKDPSKAGQRLKNPHGDNFTPEFLARGKDRYEIFCSMCHGSMADGKGRVSAVMPLKPPALTTAKIKDWKDGRIYHVIVDGQGVMGSYAGQVRSEEDRWAIVNYIRTLQKKLANN